MFLKETRDIFLDKGFGRVIVLWIWNFFLRNLFVEESSFDGSSLRFISENQKRVIKSMARFLFFNEMLKIGDLLVLRQKNVSMYVNTFQHIFCLQHFASHPI